MSAEFFSSIKVGNLDKVRRLLYLDMNLMQAKENGLSPVLVAAYNNRPEMATFLASKAISLTIFEAAAVGRTIQVMKHLARDPELVNAYAEDGIQPLGLACAFGHHEAAEYLIKAGAHVNSSAKNETGVTPLHSATAGDHVRIVELLLENGADPNMRDQNGNTPLHTAAQNGDATLLRILLFGGANPDIKNLEDKKPIDLAMRAGKAKVIKLLKEGITRRYRTMREKSIG